MITSQNVWLTESRAQNCEKHFNLCLEFETIGVGDNNNNNNNKFIQYYHFVQVLPIKITIINS